MSDASFRQLLPVVREGLTAADVAADWPSDPGSRPAVIVNMISSVDGHATVGGRTRALANSGDTALFGELRAAADGVLVGAGTVRAEHYGLLVRDEERLARRRAAGREEQPLAAVVSRSLALPLDRGLFADPAGRVVIITPEPERTLAPCAAQVSYIREHEMATALERLRTEHGIRRLVCEGGPHFNASLIPGGLADELALALASRMVGGIPELGILAGAELPDGPAAIALRSLYESGGYLFARYALAGV